MALCVSIKLFRKEIRTGMPNHSHSFAGKIPAIAALAYHRASGRNAAPPNQSLSYSENFLYMLDASNKINYK